MQSAPYDAVLRGGRVIDPAQGLDGVALIRCDVRQSPKGVRLETIAWPLSRFAVQSPIGDLIEPLTSLAVHIVEVEKIAQLPEVLPHVTDAATFHLSLLPSTGLITGARVKVEITGKGQEPRMDANE